MTAEPQRCQDIIDMPVWSDAENRDRLTVVVRCGRLVVTAKGIKVEHIHHSRDLDIPGCEQARVTWTRRR
jgi:hypothetical protein